MVKSYVEYYLVKYYVEYYLVTVNNMLNIISLNIIQYHTDPVVVYTDSLPPGTHVYRPRHHEGSLKPVHFARHPVVALPVENPEELFRQKNGRSAVGKWNSYRLYQPL